MKNALHTARSLCLLAVPAIALNCIAVDPGAPVDEPLDDARALNASCSVSYTVVNQWSSGFTADVVITNQSSTPYNGWTLSWTFPNGQTLKSLWDGVGSQSGSQVTATNASWNGSVAPGASVTLGFTANGTSTALTNFMVNGASCGGGSGSSSSSSSATSSATSTSSSSSSGAGGAGGSGGSGGSGGAGGSGGSGDTPPATPCDFPHDQTVDVSNAAQLTAALGAATPGTRIRLAAGVYSGRFKANVSGTQSKPIILCGPRGAVLDGGSTSSGYVLHATADRLIFSGFSVRNGQKGIMLDGADDNLLVGLAVFNVGQEAVHFRTHSRRNTISWSEIYDTGLSTPGYGEGIYVGSAKSNWDSITGSSTTPDSSDQNRILYNELGPGITAEHIDIKEGTTGGEVRGNTFNGAGISGANYADSWMDVKGNGWTIAENVGTGSPKDGFQTHVQLSGWGNNNVFEDNTAIVNGPGHGFWIDSASTGTVVRCNNDVQGAAAGFANVACAN